MENNVIIPDAGYSGRKRFISLLIAFFLFAFIFLIYVFTILRFGGFVLSFSQDLSLLMSFSVG